MHNKKYKIHINWYTMKKSTDQYITKEDLNTTAISSLVNLYHTINYKQSIKEDPLTFNKYINTYKRYKNIIKFTQQIYYADNYIKFFSNKKNILCDKIEVITNIPENIINNLFNLIQLQKENIDLHNYLDIKIKNLQTNILHNTNELTLIT